MALMEGMTAIIVGSIFGGLFVITCLISSIKAVRDRWRIKKRIAAKAKQHIETEEGKIKTNDIVASSTTSNGVANTKPQAVAVISDHQNIKTERKSANSGIYNVSFIPGNGDVNSTCKYNESKTLPAGFYRTDRHKVDHLSPECLAVQKSTRRYSYEVAVVDNSWMPLESPSFASSDRIIKTYSYGVNNKPRSTSVGCENRAYDVDEVKAFKLTEKL